MTQLQGDIRSWAKKDSFCDHFYLRNGRFTQSQTKENGSVTTVDDGSTLGATWDDKEELMPWCPELVPERVTVGPAVPGFLMKAQLPTVRLCGRWTVFGWNLRIA